jgi:hypothetical protein
MGIRHPWEITPREFVEQVRRDYGMEIDISALLGRPLVFQESAHVYVLARIELDEVLPPNLLRTLCRLYGVPPVDFSLDPDHD